MVRGAEFFRGAGIPIAGSSEYLAVSEHSSLGDAVVVPDAELLFAGNFKRAGNDLVLTHEDKRIVLHDYFSHDKRPALSSPSGATLSAEVVERLAGPANPGEYAQATAPVGNLPIGRVELASGVVTVMRANGVTVQVNVGDVVFKGDVIQTDADSAAGISFTDGTAFSLSARARMVLNEFVYDANGTSNSALLTLVQGTVGFVAGKIAKSGDMRVDTPAATMGIRGTAVKVEIPVEVTATNGTVKFSVMVEPDGTTGSYNLYDKNTGALLATVNQAGLFTLISPTAPGQPPSISSVPKTQTELAAEQQIVLQVFQYSAQSTQNPIGPPQNHPPGSGTPPPDQQLQQKPEGTDGRQGQITTGTITTTFNDPTTNTQKTSGISDLQLPPVFEPVPINFAPAFDLSNQVTRVAINGNAFDGPAHSFAPSISGDGQIAAFEAAALLPSTHGGDTGGARDVFLLDRTTLTITSLSDGHIGDAAPGETFGDPSVSLDGRFVVFQGRLTTEEGDELTRIYIYDHSTDQTTRLTDPVTHQAISGNAARISEDGQFIALEHVEGGVQHIVVVDRNGTTLHDVSSDAGVHSPEISAGGRFVTFWSDGVSVEVTNGSNVATAEALPSGGAVLYVFDRLTDTVSTIASLYVGTPDNADSLNVRASMSADGRFIVFASDAGDPLTGDGGDGHANIFLYDQTTSEITQVSSALGGGPIDGDSVRPQISADGRFITFTSTATDLVSGDTNGKADTFIYDRATNTTSLVSASASGLQGNGDSLLSSTVSGDGLIVGFGGLAGNLAPLDFNGTSDIFVVDRSGGTAGAVADNPSGVSLSAAGRLVFSDPDLGDAHSVTVTPQAGAAGTLTASVAQDSTGGSTGIIQWNYTVAESFAQALAAGELRDDIFAIVVSDDHGGTAIQNVRVTIVGTRPLLAQPAFWTNGAGGNFDNALNWSTSAIPTFSDDVLIDHSGIYTVTSAASRTISELTVIAAATLAVTAGTFVVHNNTHNDGTITVGDGAALQISGDVANAGTIGLDSTTLTAALLIDGEATLNGGGHITLSDSEFNIVTSAGESATLNNIDNVISGSGRLGNGHLALHNDVSGTIEGNGALNQLIIDTGGVLTNDGTILATGAAGLLIQNTSVTNNNLIEASGSGSLEIDGAVNNTFAGTIDVGDEATASITAVLNVGSVEVDGHGTLNVGDFTNPDLGDVEVDETGTLHSDAFSNSALGFVTIDDNGAFDNGSIENLGEIDLFDGSTSSNGEFKNSGFVQLDNTAVVTSDTVLNRSTGFITLFGDSKMSAGALTNAGAIDAEEQSRVLTDRLENTAVGFVNIFDSATLTVTGDGGASTNDGFIFILDDSELDLGGEFVNDGQVQVIGDSAHIVVRPGDLTLTGGGTIGLLGFFGDGNSIAADVDGATLINVDNVISGSGNIGKGLDTLTLINRSAGLIDGQFELTIDTGNNTVVNQGTIRASDFGTLEIVSRLDNSNTVVATSLGELHISGDFDNSGTVRADNEGHVVISGDGINRGTFEANGSGQIEIDGAVENNGTIVASDGGVLSSGVTTIDNTEGIISALGAGSQITMLGTTIIGGILSSDEDGSIVAGSNAVFASITNEANVLVLFFDSLVLTGDIQNTKAISVESFSTIFVFGQTTLTGGGVVNLDFANISSGGGAVQLVNSANTISGSGQIGDFSGELSLLNGEDGVIDATGFNSLEIVTGPNQIENFGLMEATEGGTLSITSALHNTGRLVAHDGIVNVSDASFGGGHASVADGILEFDAASSLDTDFVNGTAGALAFGDSLDYTGTVSGYHLGNLLDFKDIAFGESTFFDYVANSEDTGGTLFVGDGINLAAIALAGQFTDDSFFALDDGQGGTYITNSKPLFWLTDGSGSFEDASQWTDGTVPDVINDALINVASDSPYEITSHVSHSVNSFSLADDAILTIAAGTFTMVNGTAFGTIGGRVNVEDGATLAMHLLVTNDGVIALGSSGSDTELSIVGRTTLLGFGEIVLSDNSHNSIAAGGPDATFVNVFNTISGAGRIGAGGLRLINQAGTIDASGSTALIIDTDGVSVTNLGSLTASGAGGLLLRDTTIDSSASSFPGTLQANDGSSISLDGAQIIGGNLLAGGSGFYQVIGDSVFDGTHNRTVTIGGPTVVVNDGEQLTLRGDIENFGTISLDTISHLTTLKIAAEGAKLGGFGSVVLADSDDSLIIGATAGATLTNANFISGAGQIGGGQLRLVNQLGSTISADGDHVLILDTQGNAVTNAGEIRAQGAGGLVIKDTTIDGSNSLFGTGSVAAYFGSRVTLDNATIVGGTLNTFTNGVIEVVGNDGVLDGTHRHAVTIDGVVTVSNGHQLTLQGEIDLPPPFDFEPVALNLQSTGDATTLRIGTVGATLNGGGFFQGAVTLSDDAHNIITGETADSTLTNAASISGAGLLGNGQLTLHNQFNGLITASGNQALVINTQGKTLTNDGELQAAGTGGLVIQNTIVDGSNGFIGFIEAFDGSHISLQGATILGGTITSDEDGFIEVLNSSLLDGSGDHPVANSGNIIINNSRQLTLRGAIINSGAMALNAAGADTILKIDTGNVTLDGFGRIDLSDDDHNIIAGANASVTLTNSNNTIAGAGLLGNGQLTLINGDLGTIDANQTHALVIETGSNVLNSGTIEATDGGLLIIRNTTVDNGDTGFVVADGLGATVLLESAVLLGGTLNGTDDGTIEIGSGNNVLDGSGASALTSTGNVIVADGRALTLKGVFNNSGVLSLDSAGQTTTLKIGGNVTLSAGGFIELSDNDGNVITGTTATATLTNIDNTITGAGQLGNGQLTLVNRVSGTIDANGTHALVLNTGGINVDNLGIVEATEGGTLVIKNSTIDSSGGGRIKADDAGSTVELQNATVLGGTLQTSGGGTIVVGQGANTFDGTAGRTVTNTGNVLLQDGGQLGLRGRINNTGSIALNAIGAATTLLIGTANATLQGGGQVTLSDSDDNFIVGAASTATLTNRITIVGSGHLGDGELTLINETSGTINANGTHALVLDTSGHDAVNAGVIEASDGALLVIAHTTVDSSSGGSVEARGSGSLVQLQDAILVGGTLTTSGGGTISIVSGTLDGTQNRAVNNTADITVGDGNQLTLTGTIHNTGVITIGAEGNVTKILIEGTATLDGHSRVLLSSDGNSVIDGAETGATLINVDNEISGAGHIGSSKMTLINQQQGVIAAVGSNALVIDTADHTITNAGIIEGTSAGGLLIRSNVDNASGLVEANHGNVTVLGNLTGGDAGIVDATLELAGASNATVTYFTSTGLLKLDASSLFNGQISGFAGDDAVDLADVAFSDSTTLTYASNSGNTAGVLTVSDDIHTAHLQFNGQYVLANFHASIDDQGGTLIVDPPVEGIAGASPVAASLVARAVTNPDQFRFASAPAETSSSDSTVQFDSLAGHEIEGHERYVSGGDALAFATTDAHFEALAPPPIPSHDATMLH